MSVNDAAPVIVGAGRWSAARHAEVLPSVNEMLVNVSRAAVDNVGVSRSVLERLDGLVLVPSIYNDSVGRTAVVAGALASKPRVGAMTSYGGDAGVNAMNWAADAIESGRLDVVIVAGGQLGRPSPDSEAPDATGRRAPLERVDVGDHRPGFSESEGLHGALLPHATYAMVETAMRARKGLSISEHRRLMGELMSPLTAIAAKNPTAWFPTERSPDELVTPSATNRMVSYPYTKYLNAVTTDQAAALVMMSNAAADSFAVGKDRRVFWWGGDSEVETAWLFSSRPDFAVCPAMQLAQRGALARAGIGVGRVDAFDVYSCFPSAVEMAQSMLGIAAGDGRPLSITGGLPYAGGPGAAYGLQAAAIAFEQLLDSPQQVMLLSGTGFTFTKNSAAVLSGTPKPTNADTDTPKRVTELPRDPLPIADAPSGPGRVDAYTVMHGRSGEVEYGVALGLLDSGERFLAHLPHDDDMYRSFEQSEGVGRRGVVIAGGPGRRNRFEPQDGV